MLSEKGPHRSLVIGRRGITLLSSLELNLERSNSSFGKLCGNSVGAIWHVHVWLRMCVCGSFLWRLKCWIAQGGLRSAKPKSVGWLRSGHKISRMGRCHRWCAGKCLTPIPIAHQFSQWNLEHSVKAWGWPKLTEGSTWQLPPQDTFKARIRH